MTHSDIRNAILERICELPVIDIHTHLVDGKLAAQGLHDILLYHMAVSDLYAAGCPNGARLTQYPGFATTQEAHTRIREALPYLPLVRNTSISWGIRTILKDLYGIDEQVSEDNWERIDGQVRERAGDANWPRQVIRKNNIKRIGTEFARRRTGQDDDVLQYSLEWAFFTRSQWGEFDTALYELERCWGELPSSPTPIGSGGRPKTAKVIERVADVHEAMSWYVDYIPTECVSSVATHISTDIDFRLVTDSQMEEALARRGAAGPVERDVYASYINEAFLSAIEEKLSGKIVFQFSFAAEPLPYETSSRLHQRTIAQIADMVSRHPGLRFNCFLSSLHANQGMCTLCRELPNLSLSGYWWHNFFPGAIRQVMEERLDMLPVNKQVGFFSDAYCIEWVYGKLAIVRNQQAEVLACKVESGQYSIEDAVEITRQTFFETPQSLLRMVPADL